MKILVLGGTGSIGSAVVHELLSRHHDVIAIGRSQKALKQLAQLGATPVAGDIKNPGQWVDICGEIDGVVHAAASWGAQMGEIDFHLVDSVLNRLILEDEPKAFIYTGGCWLYGETEATVATEESEFNPLASFAWSVPIIKQVLSANQMRGMVIHPAMVYERNGGVFEHIFDDAKNLGIVRVVRSESVRWPLVHRLDLAKVYALMLEKGEKGDVYNVATNHGVTIGEITRTIAARLGIQSTPVVLDTSNAIVEMGSWAEGYAIDQQMSGDKARISLGWQPEYEDVFQVIS